MSGNIRVLLADDTLIARQGWRKILEGVEGIEVVGEAITANEAVVQAMKLKPDVLLLDLDWFSDRTAGVRVIEQLKKEALKVQVVAVSSYPDALKQAVQAGVGANLTKDFSKDQLLSAIRSVSQAPLSTPVPRSEPLPVRETLTAREREILRLVKEGLTDEEIALRLFIATSTAKGHLRNVYQKLGVDSRTKAVKVATEQGLL